MPGQTANTRHAPAAATLAARWQPSDLRYCGPKLADYRLLAALLAAALVLILWLLG